MEPTMMQKLLAFLNKSPSCYHAADNVVQELIKNGYEQLWEQNGWDLSEGGRYFVMRGDASIIAFRVPKGEFRGFLISAAHSDSPTFKVREEAEVSGAGNCVRLSVEPYGGMIMRSWMDRPLSVAGRIMVRTKNGLECRLVCVDRDLLVIPSVAIHMDREVNKGTALKANVDMLPLLGCGEVDFRAMLAESAGAAQEDILSTELFLYPRMKGTLLGANEELVASGRLDDLQSVFSCLKGFLAA